MISLQGIKCGLMMANSRGFATNILTKPTTHEKFLKAIPFSEFKNRMLPFEVWKVEVRTHSKSSTDESLRKIYEDHSNNLYGLYKACLNIRSLPNSIKGGLSY